MLDFDKSKMHVLSNLEVSRVKKKKDNQRNEEKTHKTDTKSRKHKNIFKPNYVSHFVKYQ